MEQNAKPWTFITWTNLTSIVNVEKVSFFHTVNIKKVKKIFLMKITKNLNNKIFFSLKRKVVLLIVVKMEALVQIYIDQLLKIRLFWLVLVLKDSMVFIVKKNDKVYKIIIHLDLKVILNIFNILKSLCN